MHRENPEVTADVEAVEPIESVEPDEPEAARPTRRERRAGRGQSGVTPGPAAGRRYSVPPKRRDYAARRRG